MAVPPFPTENYTLLFLAIATLAIYAVVFYFMYKSDKTEVKQCEAIFFQNDIRPNDEIYTITFRVKERLAKEGTNDVIFRIRGYEKDGALVFFRDVDGEVFKSGALVNLGVALRYDIGNICVVDIACDNDGCAETEPLLMISDVYVRHISRQGIENASKSTQLAKATKKMLNNIEDDVRTWVCLDSITEIAGAGVMAEHNKSQKGMSRMLRARDIALSFTLTEQQHGKKQRAKLGYRPLHYLWSMRIAWHDPWSDYSKLDHAMVMCLDNLIVMVTITTCYAYVWERFLGVAAVQTAIRKSLYPTITTTADLSKSFTPIHEFNLYQFLTFESEWFFKNSMSLIHICWISFICCLVCIPLSNLWCRLFRMIGGKGFGKTIIGSLNKKKEENLKPPDPFLQEDLRDGNTLLLRTLECRSLHSGSSVSSSRRLRMEPMISNCPPDHVTARSVAYVRTKMSKLRDRNVMSGAGALKRPELLHESYTQSTDAPQMPPPITRIDGKGEIVRVGRYCERLVQQATKHIQDNSIIAECFELAPNAVFPHGPGGEDVCCPRRCCKQHRKCAEECFSNATFFTDEDINSVKEMLSNFSFTHFQDPQIEEKSQAGVASKNRAPTGAAGVSRDTEDSIENSDELSDAPGPSSGIKKKQRKIFRNSGCEADFDKAMSSHVTELSPTHSVSKSKEDLFSIVRRNGPIWIGKKPNDRPIVDTPRDRWKKMRSHLQGVIKQQQSRRKRQSFRNLKRKTPVPSGFPTPASKRFHAYDAVAGSESTYSKDSQGMKNKKHGFYLRGFRLKIGVFMFVMLVQLGEILFVSTITASEEPSTVTSAPLQSPTGPGRIHAACLSYFVGLIFYFVITIHLIALFSLLFDTIKYVWDRSKEEVTLTESEYAAL